MSKKVSAERVEITDEMIERAKSVRTFGLKCAELHREQWAARDGLYDFIWVEDLPEVLGAALSAEAQEDQP